MNGVTLRPAAGPADPPSSKPYAGVLGGRVHAFRFDAAGGEQRKPIPGLDGLRIEPGAVLHWAFYAEGPGAAFTPHAALAVTIDVLFDDGSRLSEEPRVRDRYGFALGADAQFAAAWSMPEQWNADSVALEPWVGRVGTVEAVMGIDGLPGGDLEGFLEVAVETPTDAETAAGALSPAERVDTRRGSHSGARFSRGNTIPIVAAPHGFCFLTPATDADDTRWPYRWSVHDDGRGRRLAALQFSHQPSPWIGDRGVLQLLPFAESAEPDPTPRIVPGTERARPFVYEARLHGSGAHVRMTGTSHTGVFALSAAAAGHRVGFALRIPGVGGRITQHPDGSFDGWIPEGPSDWGNPPRTYFAGRAIAGRIEGETISGAGHVEVRIAQSFLSIAQARSSLEAEAPATRSVDELSEALRTEWDELLGAVTLPDADPDDRAWTGLAHDDARAQLASALYRLHLYPNSAAEDVGSTLRFANPMVDAAHHGDDATGAPIADGELFVNNGYWDTYRTAWSALALLAPQRTGRMLDGLLEQWRRGRWMARWSAPGYVDSMVGTSSDQIFADGERWGIGFDHEAAFESAWRNACERSDDPRRGRKGIGPARFRGYVSSDIPEGMSWSLENAVSDAAIGRLAGRLAACGGEDAARYRAHARYFGNRARSHRMLFDTASGFFRGRDASGRFAPGPFDPRTWGGDNVETNAWGMSVSPVHDGTGLAELHGGRARLRAHLDRLFAEPETAEEAFAGAYGTVIHEQREARALRSGMCAISNQPAHHIPWMHVHGDQPWRAGEIVHGLAARLFTGAMIGQGFPGDEDNGEMSAWWLWAALGLYPLELASGELRIGSPLFDDITVHRAGGGSLRVRSQRTTAEARWLTAARLDGVQLDRAVLDIDVLAEGADVVLELEFTADAAAVAASPLWALAEEQPELWHPDLTGAGARSGHPLETDHAPLFDDGANPDTAVVLAEGGVAGWCFDEPTTITDVTVTAAAPAAADALRWQASEDGRTWRDLVTTHRESLPADRTTPFTLAKPTATRMLRVRASAPVTLRQLEMFALDDRSSAPGTPPETAMTHERKNRHD